MAPISAVDGMYAFGLKDSDGSMQVRIVPESLSRRKVGLH